MNYLHDCWTVKIYNVSVLEEEMPPTAACEHDYLHMVALLYTTALHLLQSWQIKHWNQDFICQDFKAEHFSAFCPLMFLSPHVFTYQRTNLNWYKGCDTHHKFFFLHTQTWIKGRSYFALYQEGLGFIVSFPVMLCYVVSIKIGYNLVNGNQIQLHGTIISKDFFKFMSWFDGFQSQNVNKF